MPLSIKQHHYYEHFPCSSQCPAAAAQCLHLRACYFSIPSSKKDFTCDIQVLHILRTLDLCEAHLRDCWYEFAGCCGAAGIFCHGSWSQFWIAKCLDYKPFTGTESCHNLGMTCNLGWKCYCRIIGLWECHVCVCIAPTAFSFEVMVTFKIYIYCETGYFALFCHPLIVGFKWNLQNDIIIPKNVY